MSSPQKSPRTYLKYRGRSRSVKLRLDRLQRQIDSVEDKIDLWKMSDFLNGVSQLSTEQQINLLEYLKHASGDDN